MQAVKIDTGCRVLNRQYDRGNNLKVNLFVVRELSVESHLQREAPNCQVFHSERGHLYIFIAWENYFCKRAYFYDARVLPNQHHLRASMQDDASSSGIMPPPSSLGKNIGFIYLRSLLYQFIHYVINFYIK